MPQWLPEAVLMTADEGEEDTWRAASVNEEVVTEDRAGAHKAIWQLEQVESDRWVESQSPAWMGMLMLG